MKWYDEIEHDNEFRYYVDGSVKHYGGNIRNHPEFQRFTHNPMRMNHPHPDSHITGYHTISTLDADGMTHIAESIGAAMFLYLLERNPELINDIITKAMQSSHNNALTTSMNDAYMNAATQACGFDHKVEAPSMTVTEISPKNEDYEYWYDFNSSEDSVVVTCDLWGEGAEDFIKEFEFEFDDDDEKRSALNEAELLVRQLSSGEVQLVDLIGTIPAPPGTTITSGQIHDAYKKLSLTDKLLQLDTYSPTYFQTPDPARKVSFQTRYGTTLGSPSDIIKYAGS